MQQVIYAVQSDLFFILGKSKFAKSPFVWGQMENSNIKQDTSLFL